MITELRLLALPLLLAVSFDLQAPAPRQTTVDEKAGTVTHHVQGSLFPEDVGDDWVRPFTLQGDTLTLRLTGEDGLTRTLVFQRMR